MAKPIKQTSTDCPLCGADLMEQRGSDHPQQAVYEVAPKLAAMLLRMYNSVCHDQLPTRAEAKILLREAGLIK